MASWRRRAEGVPARLVSFRLTEWPSDACPHEAIRQWRDACLAWLAEDSNQEPMPGAGNAWLAGDSNRVLPFGQYGDALDVLRESGRLRQSFPACPAEGQPAQWKGNEVRHV